MRLLQWEGTNLNNTVLTIGVPQKNGTVLVEGILISIGLPFKRVLFNCRKGFMINYILEHSDIDLLSYINQRIVKSLSDRIKLEKYYRLES